MHAGFDSLQVPVASSELPLTHLSVNLLLLFVNTIEC